MEKHPKILIEKIDLLIQNEENKSLAIKCLQHIQDTKLVNIFKLISFRKWKKQILITT